MALLSSLRIGFLHASKCKFSTITPQIIKLCVGKNTSYLVPYVWKSTGRESVSRLEYNDGVANRDEGATKYETFDKMMESRRVEAQRSILVQVQSEQSCAELHAYCSQYGQVAGMHHYMLPESLHFVLVEFSSAEDVAQVMSVSTHSNRAEVVPVRSPFLWFRARDKARPAPPPVAPAAAPVETYGNAACNEQALRDRLLAADSFSAQLAELHAASRLPELGVRLRFLTARQAELSLVGLFPRIRALPFGSTVNGFGRRGCDLDLVLALDDTEGQDCDAGRLVFHAKGALANGRTQVQRHMEAVGDLCQLFLPGCGNVRRILHARVPIVKYRQELTDVDCDLSMTNMCAVHMSELLHVLGAADPRVRPLVFAVRCWARAAGLTSPTPGRWVTNFALSLLTLFYLQQRGVLPSLDRLAALAGPGDRRVTSEGVNCTFLRDPTAIPRPSPPPPADDLETLLLGFFEYFAAFDFSSQSVSLNAGRATTKPEHCALHVGNPLERALNVTQNVSPEEAERMRVQLRTAAWSCESRRGAGQAAPGAAWGLVALLDDAGEAVKTKSRPGAKPSSSRLMEVRELFAADAAEAPPLRKAEPRKKGGGDAPPPTNHGLPGKQAARSGKPRRRR